MRRIACRVLVAAMLAAAGVAQAQSYPARVVKMVVSYAPGGQIDGVARLVANELGKLWGQPVVIENRAGADGNIGTDAVAKSLPDGYTLLFTANGPLTINASLFGKMPFDPVRDLVPVTRTHEAPLVLVVPASLPVASMQELITYLKTRPGKLNYSSAGNGTTTHLAGELFKLGAGVDVVHVPYKGGADMTTAVITGDAAFNIGGLNFQALVRAGKVKALAVSGQKRFSLAPELPTMIEAGLPDFEVVVWGGLVVPAKTPQDIVAKVSRDTVRVLGLAEIRQKLNAAGVEPVGNTPEEFAAQIRVESARWARVIKAAGIQNH